MEERFTTPDTYAQRAKEELENKRYRIAINEINESIRYSTDKIQYMLIKVKILSEASQMDASFKRECLNYISSNLNLFYDKLSCDKFVDILNHYDKCFIKYDSDIIDILKTKKIPYVLSYAYSNKSAISTNEIMEKAKKSQSEKKLVEALEHIRILETKNSMCKESNILKRKILNELEMNEDSIDSSEIMLDEENIDYNNIGINNSDEKGIKNFILKNKKILSIVGLISLILFLLQLVLYATGVIPAYASRYSLGIESGRYASLDNEDGIAIPIDEEIKFNLKYKKFPFYGKVNDIEYTVDDYDVVSINSDGSIVGVKTGETNLNVIRDGKVVHRFIVKVVKPSVLNISLEYSKELNYIGDTASVVPHINREYDFGDNDRITYKSTDESVITVDELGVVNAVGIGSAYISVTCDGTTVEDNIIISPYIEEIKVDSNVELEVGDAYKFDISVTTNPINQDYPDIKFNLGKVYNEEIKDNGNILEIDEAGNIKAIKTGIQEIIIKCGNYETKSTIKVYRKSIKNSSVENIKVESSIDGNILNINLTWDGFEIEEEHGYKIYAKVNGDYNVIDTVMYSFSGDNKTISKDIAIDISDKNGKISIPIYIVASDSDEESKKSKTITVSENYKNPNDISEKIIMNLRDSSQINEEYIDVILEWDNLDVDCRYNIYVKDNEKSKYKFEHKGVVSGAVGASNSYSLGRYYDEADLDIYIIAENDYGKSKKSNIITVRFDD